MLPDIGNFAVIIIYAMLTKEELLKGFEESTNALVDHLAAFDHKTFNRKPSHEKWSAAQVADHILKIDNVVIALMSGFCAATSRDPFAKKQLIEEHMYDFDKAFSAPEFILPATTEIDQNTIASDILKARAIIRNLVMVSDITETCMDSKHPGFGQLTRGEWMYFNICHTNRHLKQIEKIAAVVA